MKKVKLEEGIFFYPSPSRRKPYKSIQISKDGAKILYASKEKVPENDWGGHLVIADTSSGKLLASIRYPLEPEKDRDPAPRSGPFEGYGEDFKGMDIKVTVVPEELEQEPKKKEEKK